jgi:glutathione synthase/RimK-type ligase-like ATP-grasp enzyme
MFRMMACLLVNSAQAIDLHTCKPYQLQLMRRRNIRIPHTLISDRLVGMLIAGRNGAAALSSLTKRSRLNV